MGKEILLILIVLVIIVLIIFVIARILFPARVSGMALLTYIISKTLAISFFPILLMVLFEQYTHQRALLKKALQMNKSLDQPPTENQNLALIQLAGENGKMVLQLHVREIIMLESDGNYVDVFHFNGEEVKKTLIRSSLKALAEHLPPDHFFQCHKSYIINREHVVSVKGNARNFELSLRGMTKKVPVSRSRSEALSLFLRSSH